MRDEEELESEHRVRECDSREHAADLREIERLRRENEKLTAKLLKAEQVI
jgi:hypothetical protein